MSSPASSSFRKKLDAGEISKQNHSPERRVCVSRKGPTRHSRQEGRGWASKGGAGGRKEAGEGKGGRGRRQEKISKQEEKKE